MKDENIKENESISRGLEDFLDQELQGSSYANTSPRNSRDLDIIIPSYSDSSSYEDSEDEYEALEPIATPTQRRRKSSVSDDTDDLSDLRLFHQKPKKKSVKYMEEEAEYTPKQKHFSNKKNSKKKHSSKKKSHAKAGKKKQNKEKKSFGFLKTLVIILLIFLISWYFIVGSIYQKMQYDDSASELRGAVSSGGVTNILLIGNDARSLDERGRSDAMILLTISNKTHSVQMTSLLRDMYVDIPGHDGNRINAAYSYGGPQLLCQTVEQNLGIKVNHYVIVNFHAFAALVDAVGGIDLEVSNEEVQWINAYLNEYNLLEGKEMTTDYLDTSLSGTIHLNGPQALAYSRNRYIGTDFGRTERQRKVLSQIMKKLPLALVTNTGEVIDGLFPNLKTNLTHFDCYLLSFKAASFLLYDKEQSTIPAEGTYSNKTIRDMAVLSVDFEENKKLWNNAVYGK